MTPELQSLTPGLATYLKSLRKHPANSAVDHLVLCVCFRKGQEVALSLTTSSLLRRRQVRGSRPCAAAATHLFLRIIAESKFRDSTDLLERVRAIGRRLQSASPTELVLGNITRRVLGLIREVNENPSDEQGTSTTPIQPSRDQTFDVLATRDGAEHFEEVMSIRDVKEDVLNGLREMLDELDQADEQVASYALEHIHPGDTILTYTSSLTVQKFLLSAAKKRKFTVIHVEGYPNEHGALYDTVMNGKTRKDSVESYSQARLKPLAAAGVTAVIIPDSAIYTVMSQVTKVLLPMHIGFPNGGFLGAAGSNAISMAAKAHQVPVLALGAVYKLTPLNFNDKDSFTELGDPEKVLSYTDGDLAEHIDVINPISDYVNPEQVDLCITNMSVVRH